MSRKMDMTVNKLPAGTWNWLKMNETRLYDAEILREAEYRAEFTGNVGCRRLSSDEDFFLGWDDIETGMGKDIDILGEEIGANLIYVKDSSNTCCNKGQADTAVLRVAGGRDKEFAGFYIYANENTELDVSIVLDRDSSDSREALQGLLAVQIKIYAEKGAKVRLHQVQLLDLKTVCLCDIGGLCEENSEIELTKLELGAGEVYTGVHVRLKGEGSRFNSETGYIGEKKQRLDMNYVVRHNGRRTTSRMKVTGVLKDEAYKLFRGSIDFQPGCTGAKGDEREEILLLGDDMVNRTIPLILCGEEKVEGNHGASIGGLDEKTLFYLASRGISHGEAERLIAKARIDSVRSRIPVAEIRQRIAGYFDSI